MESNIEPTQSLVQPTFEAPLPFWKRKIVWVCLAILVFVMAGFIYAISKSYRTSTSQVVSETREEQGAKEVFLYMPRNLELRINDTWEPISISDISLPEGYSGALFALQKDDARCILAYLRMPGSTLDVREGERAFMVNNEYTGDQYIGYVNNNILTVSYPRSFLGGKHDWPMGNDDDIHYSNAFVMYSPHEEVALDPVCVKEVGIVMGQLRSHYETATLDTNSNGILYIVSERVGDSEVDQVRYMPAGSTTAYSIMGLTATSRPQPQFVDGTLYVVVESELRTVDPFNKTSVPLPHIDLPEGETINSFWIEGNKLFYLAGVNCNSYMAKCDLGLYEYDLNTNSSVKLAEHLTYRNIIGYDPDAKEVLMTYVWADGGERSENSGVYQYASGQIQKVDSYELIEDRFTKSTEIYDYVVVQDGKMTAPTESLLTREDRWPITHHLQ